MLLQVLPQGLAQDAHAAAVNHPHPCKPGEKGMVDKLLDFPRGIVNRAPDDVDFRGYVLVFILE